ncbi:MAG TPA: caspase family protein [Kofleriaceae bacterium]|nr:caspase family protein [Kofleriaceae bacterium]
MRLDIPGRDPSSTPAAVGGRRFVAVIGIDQYHRCRPLTNAVRDARGACELFVKLGFQPIAELYDDAATADRLQALVTDELNSLGGSDSLIIFYAGHGGTREQRVGDDVIKTGYIIPVDGDDTPDRVASWVDLEGWLRSIARLPALHILVVLDACYLGIALDPAIKWRDVLPPSDTRLHVLATRRSRRIITSALDDQRARDDGPVAGHSLFTGCLIEALTGGMGASDRGTVTGSELGVYVRNRVISYPRSEQTPDFGTFELDQRGEMPVPLLRGDTVILPFATKPPVAPQPTRPGSRPPAGAAVAASAFELLVAAAGVVAGVAVFIWGGGALQGRAHLFGTVTVILGLPSMLLLRRYHAPIEAMPVTALMRWSSVVAAAGLAGLVGYIALKQHCQLSHDGTTVLFPLWDRGQLADVVAEAGGRLHALMRYRANYLEDVIQGQGATMMIITLAVHLALYELAVQAGAILIGVSGVRLSAPARAELGRLARS